MSNTPCMWIMLDHAGRRRRVRVAWEPMGGVWVGYPGGSVLMHPQQTPCQTDPKLQAPPSAQILEQNIEIRAPMTGWIVQVLTQERCHVTDQSPLVVLEAMKMEYRMLAPQPAYVLEIHCRAGDGVDAGALLITLEPSYPSANHQAAR